MPYTPGPWGVYPPYDDGRDSRSYVIAAMVETPVDGELHYRRLVAAGLSDSDGETAEDEANARLIAAAPAMIDALQRVVREVVEVRTRWGAKFVVQFPTNGQTMAMVEAAIAQAEGR